MSVPSPISAGRRRPPAGWRWTGQRGQVDDDDPPEPQAGHQQPTQRRPRPGTPRWRPAKSTDCAGVEETAEPADQNRRRPRRRGDQHSSQDCRAARMSRRDRSSTVSESPTKPVQTAGGHDDQRRRARQRHRARRRRAAGRRPPAAPGCPAPGTSGGSRRAPPHARSSPPASQPATHRTHSVPALDPMVTRADRAGISDRARYGPSPSEVQVGTTSAAPGLLDGLDGQVVNADRHRRVGRRTGQVR